MKGGNARYGGRFIKENFGDRHEVKPGEVFLKSWTYRNDAKIAWPQDLMFVQTSGDDMQAHPVMVSCIVEQGQEYTWELQLTAPKKPGRYMSYYRMQTGQNIRFGHKVWCDIVVVEEDKSAFEEEPKVKDPLVEPEIPKVPEQPNLSEVLKQSKTPRQLYFDEVA